MWRNGSTRIIDGRTYFGHFTANGWVAECEVILVGEEYDETTNTRHLSYMRVVRPDDSGQTH